MDPDIRSFSQIEKLIRENPQRAKTQAFEWERFLKANTESSLEILSIKTVEEFSKWASEHPEKHIDPSVWEGKEISEYYSYLQKQSDIQPQKEVDVKPTQSDAQKEESAPNISPSDINRIIRQEPPTKPSPLGEIGESVGREIGQTEQTAQSGISSAGKAGSRAAAQAGKIAAQAGRLAAQAASKGAMALLASPVGWVIIAIVIGIVIIVFLIVFLNGRNRNQSQSPTVRETNTEATTASTGILPQAITPTPAEP